MTTVDEARSMTPEEVAASDLEDLQLQFPFEPFATAQRIRKTARQKILDEQAAAMDATHEVIYVRFGDCPESGYSRNDIDGTDEPGISVFRAWLVDGKAVIDRRTASFGALLFLRDRPLYQVSGTLLETTGSDGEPLLTDCHTIGTIEDWEVME